MSEILLLRVTVKSYIVKPGLNACNVFNIQNDLLMLWVEQRSQETRSTEASFMVYGIDFFFFLSSFKRHAIPSSYG